MTFFRHTESWFRGEALEGGMLVVYGSMLVILALYLWKFGQTATARVLVVPLLVVGLGWGVAAGAGLALNPSRVETARAEYDEAPTEFVQNEKKRVESFFDWYRPLLIGWSTLIILGLGLFHFWGGDLGRAIGLAVILCGVAGLMVDHTSEQNTRAYLGEIERELGPR